MLAADAALGEKPYLEKSVRCLHMGGFHDMVYSDWVPKKQKGRTIVCVHGLTRSGRDFDRVAAALCADGFRVIAPDIVGRGRSGTLGQQATYEVPQYISDISTMLAAEHLREVDWIGTSMGGLIGMGLAGLQGQPIRRMMINDVGPFIPKAALERIGEYVGRDWRFDSFDDAVNHVRLAYEPFGLTRDEDWRYLAALSLRQDVDGTWTNTYDLRIADAFKGDIADVDLWALWDMLTVPILLLRGAESDLLPADTAKAMTERGPRADLVEVPDCGHAPSLMVPDQIETVLKWAASGV